MVGVAFADAVIRAATPLLLAALGEVVNQRAGNLNLGVEGIMLVGALTGFATTVVTGNPYIGFAVAIIPGIALASIHAFLTVSLKSDQVISGIMITLLGTGLTVYFGGDWTAESIEGFQEVTIPIIGPYLVEIPVLGTLLFENTFPEFLAIALVPVVWYLLFRSNLGLEIQSVGESPATADIMGISVTKVRYGTVLFGGALASAGGAALSLAVLNLWVEGMVAGRGWIVIALVVFAQWFPLRVFAGAYLFGFVEVLRLRTPQPEFLLEATEPIASIFAFLTNPSIMATYPYVATVVVLVLISYRTSSENLNAPAAFLEPYRREED